MIIYYHCTKDTSTVIYTRFIQINHHDTNSVIKSNLSEGGADLKVEYHRMSSIFPVLYISGTSFTRDVS